MTEIIGGIFSVCYVAASLYWLWNDHRNPDSWENDDE